MRKLIGLLIILLPLAVFSQKVVNGFGVEVFLGKTYTAHEHLKFNYNSKLIQADMTGETSCFGGSAYFPFDMGIKRHRFTLAIGFEYKSVGISMETNKPIEKDNIVKEGINLKSTTYTPFLQFLYRPHFYLGPIHMSFSIGANFKYAAFNTVEICDKDNAAIITYDKNIGQGEEGYIDFNGNVAAERLRDLKFSIDPRMGFDFYIGNSLMISLFGIVPDVSSAVNTKSLKLQYGGGITYLIRTNKITEAKILQQYKK